MQTNLLKWVTDHLAGLSWSQALKECTSTNYLNFSECHRLLHKCSGTLLAITYHAAMPANSGAGLVLSATSVSLSGLHLYFCCSLQCLPCPRLPSMQHFLVAFQEPALSFILSHDITHGSLSLVAS